jgi:hypothetical protein
LGTLNISALTGETGKLIDQSVHNLKDSATIKVGVRQEKSNYNAWNQWRVFIKEMLKAKPRYLKQPFGNWAVKRK